MYKKQRNSYNQVVTGSNGNGRNITPISEKLKMYKEW